MRLAPCSKCRRHCRITEKSCPFCGSRRLAIGAGAVAFAALAVGWSGTAAANGPRDAGADANAISAEAIDAGMDADADALDAERPVFDDSSRYVVALYGVPPEPGRPGGGCGTHNGPE